MNHNKNSWIAVSATLPKREEPVLVWCGFINIAMLNEYGNWVCVLTNASMHGVTHWQELPQQP